MALPPGFLDELKTRLPLSSYVGRSVRLARAGREWKGCCPFHKEKSASFYVNDDKAFYHCFGCGVHGDVITFAMQTQGWEFPEAIETLAREAGLEVPQRESRESPQQQDARARLYQLLDAATAYFAAQLYAPAGTKALAYLQRRGLTDATIAAWRLGYAPSDAQALRNHLVGKGYSEQELLAVGLWRQREDRSGGYGFFRDRTVFPVSDRRGRPVAFSARVLDGAPADAPKYINSSEHQLFKKGELLFGAEHAKTRADTKAQPLLLVEGNMDVVSLWQAGVPAVAPLGTALTEAQLAALWQLARSRDAATPVLCFDGDKAGQRAAARAVGLALPHLAPEKTLLFAFLPAGEDPDSLVKTQGRAALDTLVAAARPLADVLWEIESNATPVATPEARAALEGRLRDRTGQIADPILRGHYERDIKDRLWQLFNNRYSPRRQAGYQGGGAFQRKTGDFKSSWQRNATATPPPPLPPGLQAKAALQERIALTLVINNPFLQDEAAEWLLDHRPINARFAPIFAALSSISDAFAEPASLDAEACCRYLEAEGGGAALSELNREALYRQYGFTRPDSAPDEARTAWRELMTRGDEKLLLESEIAVAREAYKAEPSEAAWGRLQSLLEEEHGALNERLDGMLNEARR